MMSFGLGGDATRMLINRFSLGYLDVVVEITPDPEVPSGGNAGTIIWRPDEKKYQLITFTIRYKNRTWVQKYRWTDNFINSYIKVTNIMSTIINSFKFVVQKVTNTYNNIRIKR